MSFKVTIAISIALYLLGAAALTTHAMNVVDENSIAFFRRMVTVAVPVDVWSDSHALEKHQAVGGNKSKTRTTLF